jgi:hypothetical protein
MELGIPLIVICLGVLVWTLLPDNQEQDAD